MKTRPLGLLLALVALATMTVSVFGHHHSELAGGGAHADLPVYSGTHEQPDRSVHVEAAERLETSPCVGCLHRQRKTGLGALGLSFEGSTAEFSHLGPAVDSHPIRLASRNTASRAPPRV